MPDRSARAWTERMAVRPLGRVDAVDSQSGTTYVVDPAAGTCTCPDARIRGEICKHLRRVAIEIATRRPPSGKRLADCAACGIATTADAPTDPPLCDACRVAPGDVVLDRETGDRLVVLAVTDRRADEVPIVGDTGDAGGRTTTVADYPTNDGYPADDLVVAAASLPERRHSYFFPLSRLRRTDDAALLA